MENLITSSESLALENFRKREVIEDAFCPTYSPTGNSFAYIARRDQKYLVVKDGVEGDRYDHIYALTYSPDGNSFAYVAKKDGKYLIVKDGVEGSIYDGVYNMKYSPTGNSFAYVAKRDGKWFVVVDGIEGDGYDDIYNLTYSPDGRSFAYQAKRDWKLFVVRQAINPSSSESAKNQNNKTNSSYNLTEKCLEIISDTSSTIKNLASKTEIKKYLSNLSS